MSYIKISLLFCLLLMSGGLFAQLKNGSIDDEEIKIEKDRKIELGSAIRVFEKIAETKPITEAKKKLIYEFTDRRLATSPTRFTPTANPYIVQNTNEDISYNSFARIGLGNYGRIFAEGLVSLKNTEDYAYGFNAKHNSTFSGPVDDKNSAFSEQTLKAFGKYLTSNYKVDGTVRYAREQYYFYGYRPRLIVPETENIKQVVNRFGADFSIENAKAGIFDYRFGTGLTYLTDHYKANEVEWKNTFDASMVVTNNLIAFLNLSANVGKHSDSLVNARNLFKVKPTFQYHNDIFKITAGLNVASENENNGKINHTSMFPVVEADVKLVQGLHVFSGIDGDIQRNTLSNHLAENKWLASRVQLRNTEKSGSFYGGLRGTVLGGLTYEARVGFADFRNLAYSSNSAKDSTKFTMLYDTTKTRVTTITGQINYQYQDRFRSVFRLDFNGYSTKNTLFEQPWHRPKLTVSWSNTLVFAKKIIVNTEFFWLTGIYGKNFATGEMKRLSNILDLNTRITYQISNPLAVYVSLNNLTGRNYERYLNYQQQSLNFLVGLTYSF